MERIKDTKRLGIILLCSMALYGPVFFGVIFDAIERQDLVALMKDVALLFICGTFRCLSKRSGNGMASFSLVILSLFWGIIICIFAFIPTWLAMNIYSSAVPFSLYGMRLIELYTGLIKLGLLRLCIVGGLIVVGLLVTFWGLRLFVICKDDGIIQ